MARLKYIVVSVFLLCAVMAAAPATETSPRVNYMLNCQGCHLADGSGLAGKVPSMNASVGRFLHSAEGRAFIIQVPGVAFAPLSDAQVSELMNWMLIEFSAGELPADFQPYTREEVQRLRREPETDPDTRRLEVLSALREKDVPESL